MERKVAPQLLADERILWQGAPIQGLMLRPLDLALIPFSLFWAGMALFWNIKTWDAAIGSVSRLGGLVMLIVGVYAVIGRFLLDGYMRRHLSYVVTDRRAIIARTGPWPTRLSLDLTRLPHLELKEMPDGTGTILFGAPRPVRGNHAAGLGVWQPTLDPTPQFIGIPDADAVFALIQSRTGD